MKHGVVFAAVMMGLAMVGCDSPGHEYWDEAHQTIEIDGRRYEVYATLEAPRPRVQVIRRGYARRPEHRAILLAMPRAAEQATGCQIIEGSAVGDSGVMNARLTCPD